MNERTDRQTNLRRMPCTNARDLSETLVGLSRYSEKGLSIEEWQNLLKISDLRSFLVPQR